MTPAQYTEGFNDVSNPNGYGDIANQTQNKVVLLSGVY
jgi:hypothetical protein